MRKAGKILMGMLLVIGVIAGSIRLFMGHQIKETYQRLDGVPIVDVSNVKDGLYEGVEETPLVKVTVAVSIKDHQVTDVRLIRHENGKGAPAEAMLPNMIEQNTSEVDGVSGATMSSKTIRAAVRNALAKGVFG